MSGSPVCDRAVVCFCRLSADVSSPLNWKACSGTWASQTQPWTSSDSIYNQLGWDTQLHLSVSRVAPMNLIHKFSSWHLKQYSLFPCLLSAGVFRWCGPHSKSSHYRILAHPVSHAQMQHPPLTQTRLWGLQKVRAQLMLLLLLFYFSQSEQTFRQEVRRPAVPPAPRFFLVNVITRASDLCLYYDYSPAFSLFGLFATLGLPTCVPNPASKTFNPFNLPLCWVVHLSPSHHPPFVTSWLCFLSF